MCSFATPGAWSWTVPADVTQLSFDVFGAQGGNGGYFGDEGIAGRGGEATATIALMPGQGLQVNIGGGGGSGPSGPGGFNGGGASSGRGRRGGGGAASDVRSGNFELSDRIIVAGGGGGGGHQGGGGLVGDGAAGAAVYYYDGGGGTGLAGGRGGPAGDQRRHLVFGSSPRDALVVARMAAAGSRGHAARVPLSLVGASGARVANRLVGVPAAPHPPQAGA